jgi:hypothetical protein
MNLIKYLLFLLIFISSYSFGQKNFGDEFKFINEFVEADKKYVLNELYDTSDLFNISEKDKLDLYNQNRKKIKILIRKSSLKSINDDSITKELISIQESELPPSWKLLDMIKDQETNYNKLQTIGNIDVTDSGISTYKGTNKNYTFVYQLAIWDVLGQSQKRYSNQYIFSSNKKNFIITINTFDNLKIDQVLIDID